MLCLPHPWCEPHFWCEPGTCSSTPRVASSRPEPWPPGATSSASTVLCCDHLEVFWLWVLTYWQTREYSWGACPKAFVRPQWVQMYVVVVCSFCVFSLHSHEGSVLYRAGELHTKSLICFEFLYCTMQLWGPKVNLRWLVREFFLFLFCFVLRFAPVMTCTGGLFPPSHPRTELCSGEQPCTTLFGLCSLLNFAGTSPVCAF